MKKEVRRGKGRDEDTFLFLISPNILAKDGKKILEHHGWLEE